MLSNRELADEDQFQCKFCTDLCYMSMITCKDHTLGGIDINLMHMQAQTSSKNTDSKPSISVSEDSTKDDSNMQNQKYLTKAQKRAKALAEAAES